MGRSHSLGVEVSIFGNCLVCLVAETILMGNSYDSIVDKHN